jgi:DNA-binding CsgD family transcriptional regulator
MNDDHPVSLPENDYQDILEVIQKFHECRTRSELREVFKSYLLPLFEAQTGLYGWTDPDISAPQIIDTINIPESTLKVFQEYIPQDPISKKFSGQNRTVLAFDLDVPREELQKQFDLFFKSNPEINRQEHSFFKNMKTCLVTLNLPDPTLGIAIHRLAPNDKPCTSRDTRVLELLRPHLFQAIKTVVLSEELNQYKVLIEETLGKSSTATALIHPDTRIIYLNSSFFELFPLEPGQRLPAEISEIINLEMSKFDAPFEIEHAKLKLPFCKLPQGVFTLSLVKLKVENQENPQSLLLVMKPVNEPYSKINLLMQELGLTSREMEISLLIREGFKDAEISDRLFISLHTTKNHIKSIHKKLNVHDRGQLVAKLNQSS